VTLQEVSSTTIPCPPSSKSQKVIDSITIDIERLQNIEACLHKQVEATRSTNELISNLISIISALQATNITTTSSPLVSLPPPVATRGVSCIPLAWGVCCIPWIKPGAPDSFNGDRVKGCTFLTSLELYLFLTGSDFPDDQSHIHWALFYFKSGHAVTYAECVVRQEMKSGQMVLTD
jgi:hypothetical protein